VRGKSSWNRYGSDLLIGIRADSYLRNYINFSLSARNFVLGISI
jgi:hypothetical protein